MLESNWGISCCAGASENAAVPNGDSLLACSVTAPSAVSATSACSAGTYSATGSLAGSCTDAT